MQNMNEGPVVSMYQIAPRPGEDIGLFPEALADNVESESNITLLENSGRIEEVFRILAT